MRAERRFATRIAACLCTLFLCSAGLAAPQDAADLNALRTRIDGLKAELDQKEATRRESRDALRASERAISEANRELRMRDAESRATQEELKTLTSRQRAMSEVLERQQAALGRMIAARYAAGPPDVLRIVLSGDDPNEAARSMVYLAALSGAAARLLDAFRKDVTTLGKLSQSVREKASQLEAIEAEKRADRQKILAETQARKQLLENLSGDIRTSRKEIKNLVADETRLSRLVEEIGKVLSAKPGAGYAPKSARGVVTDRLPEKAGDGAQQEPFSRLRGKLRLPVRGELVARFGSPRREGDGSSKGVFIRSAEGQTVKSIAAGRVVFADWMRGFGNLLIVDHGETYLSVYGNNEALLKQAGDPVATGESIATVGSTGGSTETGLYFELRHLGKAFDPLRWSNLK